MHMTGTQWLIGSAVVLATIVCGGVSGRWAERTFVRPAESAASEATHTRTCITIDGRRFEWSSPNLPFGTLSCTE
jgi:predicted metal-binding protein